FRNPNSASAGSEIPLRPGFYARLLKPVDPQFQRRCLPLKVPGSVEPIVPDQSAARPLSIISIPRGQRPQFLPSLGRPIFWCRRSALALVHHVLTPRSILSRAARSVPLDPRARHAVNAHCIVHQPSRMSSIETPFCPSLSRRRNLSRAPSIP